MAEGRISIPGGDKDFHFYMSSRPALGYTEPPIQLTLAGFSLGVKRQGREADHSPPIIVVFKKTWIYTSTPPYIIMT
jgi:hypothetical protein